MVEPVAVDLAGELNPPRQRTIYEHSQLVLEWAVRGRPAVGTGLSYGLVIGRIDVLLDELKTDADSVVKDVALQQKLLDLVKKTDSKSLVWQGKEIPMTYSALRFGERDQLPEGAKATDANPQNPPGEYLAWVGIKGTAADATPVMQGWTLFTVRPSPRTQAQSLELLPDTTMNFESLQQNVNTTGRPQEGGGFMNSDFVEVQEMTDGEGKPVPFETTHSGSTYRYRYTLNNPVPEGGLVTLGQRGTMSRLIRPMGDGMFMYRMRHSPGGDQDTRRLEFYTLPKDATLLNVVPDDAQKREKDGRIQLCVDKLIPLGGSLEVIIRYKLPATP
jgi:hypothetical protein